MRLLICRLNNTSSLYIKWLFYYFKSLIQFSQLSFNYILTSFQSYRNVERIVKKRIPIYCSLTFPECSHFTTFALYFSVSVCGTYICMCMCKYKNVNVYLLSCHIFLVAFMLEQLKVFMVRKTLTFLSSIGRLFCGVFLDLFFCIIFVIYFS